MAQGILLSDLIEACLANWKMPELPPQIGTAGDIASARSLINRRLAGSPGNTDLQVAVSDWLYRLVRANVKRGRAFELDEVLVIHQADCLGYAQLFAALGGRFGLELGIVEVLVDNAGRYVPHHANLLNLADGSHRFPDAWYGAADIRHRRIGALVNGAPGDIDLEALDETHRLKGLPQPCIQAIILYIKGNRFLREEDLDKAISFYSRAIGLYPNNSRAYYNRGLAYEADGNIGKAELDYAQALKDESSLIRVLATSCELEKLIELDEKGVGEQEQDIYLWYSGFRTGIKMSFEAVARISGLTAQDVVRIVFRVESR